MNIKNILKGLIFIIILLFSCNKEKTIQGNYFGCNNGEYIEIYFNKDSMRIASNNKWIRLSKWRKIDIKNDTLYFDTFGEWRIPSIAKIKFIEMNKIQLKFSNKDKTIVLTPINQNLKFRSSEEFWNGFYDRKKSKNCK